MDFQIIMLSQYFNVVCTFKTSLFTCENDPHNSLQQTSMRKSQWEIFSVKRTTGLKSQSAFFQTVPQREK